MDDWNNKGKILRGSFDGQYHKLNVPTHLADKLSLDIEFTETAVTWDIAHRLELSFDDTKKQMSWLQELDTTLQSIMKNFTLGMHHTQLRDISIEMGKRFLEFCFFQKHGSCSMHIARTIISTKCTRS